MYRGHKVCLNLVASQKYCNKEIKVKTEIILYLQAKGAIATVLKPKTKYKAS